MSHGARSSSGKAWDPLKLPLFRAIWTASFISSLGTWMQQVANGWLMTTLKAEPFMVSAVEVANTLPMALLALPAGALADLIDRRRYLLLTQTWMLLASAAMGFLTYTDQMTPNLLLGCTFAMGVGVALNSPGWHSVTPEVVPRATLSSAIALNGLALNSARAVGPALGGAVLLWLGPAAAFFLNSVSFLGVITVLARWKRQKRDEDSPPERFSSALKVGLRHVRHSPQLRAALLRSTSFVVCSSALWATMPLLCSKVYGFGPQGYGLMVTGFGAGAVLSALFILPRLRSHFAVNQIVTGAWLVFAASLFALSQVPGGVIAGVPMVLAGGCWLCILANLHLVVQSSAPPWVQARAMSVYLLCFFGAASAGSALWGSVAQQAGLQPSLEIAAVVLVLTSLSGFLAPLVANVERNLEPSKAWPHPEITVEPPLEHGPILVTVEYQIDPIDAEAFREAAESLRAFRMQNGVLQWGIFVDIADPTKYREVYLEESWGSHLRQHERVSAFETETAAKVYAFHRGPGPAPVFHYAYCNQLFPSKEGSPTPTPRSYPTTDQGVPLWFVDDLNSYDTYENEEEGETTSAAEIPS